jgi:uncharacterized OsmC-like protein
VSQVEDFEYEINLIKKDNYKFEVDFGKDIAKLLMDESVEVPGGEGKGPTASFLLAAAIGNCLSASFTFCLLKKKVELKGLTTKVRYRRERNEQGFWRILKITVDLFPDVKDANDTAFLRCAEIFKNYCIVSMSVQQGIDIEVKVN